MPPEVIVDEKIPYDTRTDIWALGIITYQLLSKGQHPFFHLDDEDRNGLIKNMLHNEPNFQHFDKRFGKEGEDAMDFIKCCLTKDYTQRPKIDELLNHPWMRTKPSKFLEEIERTKLLNMLTNMKKFRERSEFQSGILSMLSQLFQENYEIFQIGKLFKLLDY